MSQKDRIRVQNIPELQEVFAQGKAIRSMQEGDFTNARIESTDLSMVILNRANLQGAAFEDVQLSGAVARRLQVDEATFVESRERATVAQLQGKDILKS